MPRPADDHFTVPIEGQELEDFIAAWLPRSMPKKDFNRILQGALYKYVGVEKMDVCFSKGPYAPVGLNSFNPESGMFICDTEEYSFAIHLYRGSGNRPIMRIVSRGSEGVYRHIKTTPILVYEKFYTALLEKVTMFNDEPLFRSTYYPTTSPTCFVENAHSYYMKVAKNCALELEMQFDTSFPVEETEYIEKILQEKIFPGFSELRDAIRKIRDSSIGPQSPYWRTRLLEASLRTLGDGKEEVFEKLVLKDGMTHSYEFCRDEGRFTFFADGSWKVRNESFIAEYDTRTGSYTIQNEEQEDISDQFDMEGLKKGMEEIAASEHVRPMFARVL